MVRQYENWTSPEQVRSAAGQLAASAETEWPLMSWQLPQLFAKLLGGLVKERWENQRTNYDRLAGERFAGQVTRAMNGLVEQGVLRKVNRGDRGPDRALATNYSVFYTPTAWDQAVEDRRLADLQAEDTRQRWAVIWDALTTAGWKPEPQNYVHGGGEPRGRPLTLPLADWEALLQEVGWK